VIRDLRVRKDRRAYRAFKDLRGNRVLRESKGQRVPPEQQEQPGQRAFKVFPVPKESRGYPVHRDLPDLPDQ